MLPYSTPPSGGGLYVIRLSEKHYYGGRTVCFATRWDDHLRALQAGKHYNPRMQRVFNKYGVFSPEVVLTLDRGAQPDAEQAWLDEHHRKPGCVNLVSSARGGMAGYKATPESIAKRVATFKARPDLIAKARASLNRNRVFVNAVTRNRKTGEKLRGRKQDPEQVEKRAASNRGRKNTSETLARMSESGKRRAQAQPTSHGEETRSLISSQQRGRVWVNDGQTNQRLFPEEADLLLAQGWQRGRVGPSVAGRVSMLDPTGQQRLVRPEDVPARLGSGWAYPPPPKPAYVPVEDPQRGHRGTVWVRRWAADGWECRRVPEGEVGAYLSDGWERGARPRHP
jgi:hypothetical protein